MRQILCQRLVGRNEETDLLKDALKGAGAGRGGAAMLLGEAGVGKSRLAREVEAFARKGGFLTLRGRAVEGPAGAYRPLSEALLFGLRTANSSDGRGMAAVLGNEELRPFRPVLGRVIPEWKVTSEQPPGDSAVLLGEAVLRLIRALAAGRSCLLILEDLHWADVDTLAVLEYLIDNAQTEPLYLLGTIRSEQRSPALTQARTMAARRAGQVLELSKLDEENVKEMARTCLDLPACPEPVADLLSSYSEGLPFLVEELLAAWVSSGALTRLSTGREVEEILPPEPPLSFADTVTRRLDALGEETRRLLAAAAVLGRYFDWTLLPEATGLGPPVVLRCLHAAVDAQLITSGRLMGGGHDAPPDSHQSFGFRHALTRSAVLAGLLPPERAALSAQLLSAVDRAHPALPGGWCDLAAGLAGAAGDSERSVRLLFQSGQRSAARGALATAEDTLNRAVALNPAESTLALEIQFELIDVLSLTGKWERVFAAGERLLVALAEANSAPDRSAEVYLRLARAALAGGQWTEADSQLDCARALTETLQRPDLAARLDALAAHVAIERSRPDRAIAFAQAALEQAERAGLPEVACEALEALGRCARVHDLDRAEAAFGRAYSIAEQNNLAIWQIRALHELGTIDIFRGGRLDRLRDARRLAVDAGALALVAILDIQLAGCHGIRSQFSEMLHVAQRSAALARRLRLDITVAVALCFQAMALAKLGNRSEMEGVCDEIERLAADAPDVRAGAWEARSFASAVEEKRAQMRRELDTAVSINQGMQVMTPSPHHGLWALLRTVEDLDGAAACEQVRLSGVIISPVNRGYLGYAEAISLGRSGRAQEAIAAAERADAILLGTGWYQHYGRRLLAEAAIADGWGDPAAWLLEACACFEGHAQTTLVSACKTLLRQIGVPASRTNRSHTGVPVPFQSLGISRREMDVLELLAEGLTNREIGERLYLSPRTVEKHVASLLAKTETRSRSQLAALSASRKV